MTDAIDDGQPESVTPQKRPGRWQRLLTKGGFLVASAAAVGGAWHFTHPNQPEVKQLSGAELRELSETIKSGLAAVVKFRVLENFLNAQLEKNPTDENIAGMLGELESQRAIVDEKYKNLKQIFESAPLTGDKKQEYFMYYGKENPVPGGPPQGHCYGILSNALRTGTIDTKTAQGVMQEILGYDLSAQTPGAKSVDQETLKWLDELPPDKKITLAEEMTKVFIHLCSKDELASIVHRLNFRQYAREHRFDPLTKPVEKVVEQAVDAAENTFGGGRKGPSR